MEQDENGEPAPLPVVVVHFDGAMCVQAGTPNSEVTHGHRLHGKGLEECRANLVTNSTWAEEARCINSVHSMYDAAQWQTLNHYFVIIRDDTIECLARGFTARIERARYLHSYRNSPISVPVAHATTSINAVSASAPLRKGRRMPTGRVSTACPDIAAPPWAGRSS